MQQQGIHRFVVYARDHNPSPELPPPGDLRNASKDG